MRGADKEVCISRLLDRDELTKLYDDPFHNSRVPDFIAITEHGVIYTAGSKLADHGFLTTNRNVVLAVSSPRIKHAEIGRQKHVMRRTAIFLNPPPIQWALIQALASRWAVAISTSDIISAISRRMGIASVRPFKAARLNHLCAATRLTTPERPHAQYSPRSNRTSGIAFASTGVAAS